MGHTLAAVPATGGQLRLYCLQQAANGQLGAPKDLLSLGPGQRELELVQRLTQKKRSGKKSTMSRRQLEARDQLAKELAIDRRDPIEFEALRYALHRDPSFSGRSMGASAHAHDLDLEWPPAHESPSPETPARGSPSASRMLASNWSAGSLSLSLGSRGSSCSCSSAVSRARQLSRSLSSLDQSSGQAASELAAEDPGPMMRAPTKSSGVRMRQMQLEQLKAQLELKLYQYEYLVAQEKSLLASCNIKMFANEGVGNFGPLD